MARGITYVVVLVVCVSCSSVVSVRKDLGHNASIEKAKHILKKAELAFPRSKKVKTPVLDAPKDETLLASKKDIILDKAYSFLGTRYRYGGTSSTGIDCSGLMFVAFKEADVMLPRSSSDMATYGEEVPLSQVTVGDLLFFSTQGGKRITHVGLVVEVSDAIYFIHSSTTKGVMVSSLSDSYWKRTYRKANRVL